MRRLLSIILLAFFGLPLASPLFALAPTSEANLPACCRRNGRHDCLGKMAERVKPTDDKPAFAPLPDNCPFAPSHSIPAGNRDIFEAVSASAVFASLNSHSIAHRQELAKGQIHHERSYQERGPPTA